MRSLKLDQRRSCIMQDTVRKHKATTYEIVRRLREFLEFEGEAIKLIGCSINHRFSGCSCKFMVSEWVEMHTTKT